MIQSIFENIQVAGMMTAVPKHREILMEKYGELFGKDAVTSFSNMVGITERRIASDKQTASDLAFVAARELLKKKAVNKDEIGILVFVTQTPDYRTPATACVLHKRLELSKDCIAFDVNLGCSGYVYGMQIVCSLMSSTGSEYGMLLVGDTVNKFIAPEDRSCAMLFGDGGSATLFKMQEGAKAIQAGYQTDGSGFKAIIVPSGCCRNMGADYERDVWADGNKRSDYDLYMNGVDVFNFAVSKVSAMINESLQMSRDKRDIYDDYVLHQANGYVLKQMMKKSKLPKDKVPISMDRYGNTSVASIPLTICDKYGEEKGSRERTFFTCGFGVGLSCGIVSFSMDQEDIYPIMETGEYYEEGGVKHD